MTDARVPLWLEDLRRQPEMLRLPRIVIPRLAFEGRCTLLSAGEKVGKSTLVGQAVAAMRCRQRFLEGEPAEGKVLWLCLDEPKADLVYRLESFGAVDGVAIVDFIPKQAELRTMLADIRPVLLVIDAMIDLAGEVVMDIRDAMQWAEVLVPLRALASDFNVAQLWIHHAIRDGSRYADSRALGAKADILVHLQESKDDPNERHVTTKGRNVPTTLRRYALMYTDGRYHLGGAELPVTTRILDAIVREPGIGKASLRELIGGRAQVTDHAIADLMTRGLIRDDGDGRRRSFVPTMQSGTPRDNQPDIVVTTCGTKPDNHQTPSGHLGVRPTNVGADILALEVA